MTERVNWRAAALGTPRATLKRMVAGLAWRRTLFTLLPFTAMLLAARGAHAESGLPGGRLRLTPPSHAAPAKATGVLDRIPTASWAMGGAAGVALAAHAVYHSLSDRCRARLHASCSDYCPDYRLDHYRESREKAEVALQLSVLAGASALWLIYNDPEEALQRMGQRKQARTQEGFKFKVKPSRGGVWATMVAYF